PGSHCIVVDDFVRSPVQQRAPVLNRNRWRTYCQSNLFWIGIFFMIVFLSGCSLQTVTPTPGNRPALIYPTETPAPINVITPSTPTNTPHPMPSPTPSPTAPVAILESDQ